MAIVIQQLDSRNFIYDGDVKSKTFKALAKGDLISIISDGSKTANLTNGTYYNNFITKDVAGVIIVDGTSGGTVDELVQSINSIVNFNNEVFEGIPINLVFADIASRDAHFSPSNQDQLILGLEIGIEDDGSGNRTVEKWVGPDAPVAYSNSYWSPSFNGKAISHTYIPQGNELPSPLLSPNVPTKYQLPVVVRKIKDFSITDIGGGVLALTYSGERTITLALNGTTSVITSANNVTVKLMMYKNGIFAPSSITRRKVGTGSDVGSMALSTSFEASKGDYFEVFIESDLATTVTFLDTNLLIYEI